METRTEVLTKRKTHRRKPGGKRKKDKIDHYSSLDNQTLDKSDGHMDVDAVAAAAAGTNNLQPSTESGASVRDDIGEPPRKHLRVFGERAQQHQRYRQRSRQQHPTQHFLPQHSQARKLPQGARSLLLRPAKVPKAPQNSTQFIIDDHENSAYFIDFEKGFTSPGARDDVGWSPYFEQDFENVYRTTREAEVIDWTHEVLVDKISSLEERVKTLEQQLSMCDPNVYMPQLQHRIVCMQDETRRIKEFRIWCPMHGKKVRLRHSVSEETSESGDCSSSSQDDKEHDESESPDDDDDDDDDDDVGEEEDGHETIHGHGGESDNGYSEDVNEDNDSDDDDDDTSDCEEPEAPNEDGMNSREALVSYSAPAVPEEKMNHDATVEEEVTPNRSEEVLSTVSESAQQHEPPKDDVQP